VSLNLSSYMGRVYVDTMVFIYHLGPRHYLSDKAEKFFVEVERGKYQAVATTFTVAEYLAVMKEILAGQLRATPAQSHIDKLKIEIENFIGQMGIELLDADDLAETPLGRSDVFRPSFQVVEGVPVTLGRDREWRGVGGADAISVVLADRAGAELFATFDEGFRGLDALKNFGYELQPLVLTDVY